LEFNSYERWIIRTGLTLIENQTQENLERQTRSRPIKAYLMEKRLSRATRNFCGKSKH